MKNVVIIGGGFGGLFAARALGKSGHHVTLLDRRNFHTFQPLLYQVATGALTTGDIATPYRTVLRGMKNVHPLMSEALAIDPHRQVITHEYGELAYDELIVATGAQHSYFGMDHWAQHASGLKTLEHALDIRQQIFRAFEQAEIETDSERQQALMTFVVIGAGPTGVELAGALGELTQHYMNGDFRRIDPRQTRILLIEAGPDVLPTMPPSLRAAARLALESLSVNVLTHARVQEIGAHYVRYARSDNAGSAIEVTTLNSHTILWAAGVQASAFGGILARATQAATDRAGRIVVAADLSLPQYPNIFVVGDLAHCENATGIAVPGLAPAAIQMGEYVAQLLKSRERAQRHPPAPFRYSDRGSMAVIGRNRAVGNLHWARISGFPAWLLWILVHIMSLIQPEKRLRVFVQWAWRYCSRSSGDRLITGQYPLRSEKPMVPSSTV